VTHLPKLSRHRGPRRRTDQRVPCKEQCTSSYERSEAGRRPQGCHIYRELSAVRGLLLLVALLGPRVSEAAQGPIRAARTPEAPKLDGRGDDPVWQRAPVFTDFLEQYPNEGTRPAPAWRTEVRVLYDNRTLFILVVCHDPDPSQIRRQLGRRDVVLIGVEDHFEIWDSVRWQQYSRGAVTAAKPDADRRAGPASGGEK